MNTETFEIRDEQHGTITVTQLNVVIAYADFLSATLAKRILRDSVAVLSTRFVVQTSFWKFELLDSSTLREMAAQDAEQAHIIIVAAEKEYGLPRGARDWIEACLRKPNVKDVAFLALLHDEDDSANGLVPYEDERFAALEKPGMFWFIANGYEGQKLATEKIIQLASGSPVGN